MSFIELGRKPRRWTMGSRRCATDRRAGACAIRRGSICGAGVSTGRAYGPSDGSGRVNWDVLWPDESRNAVKLRCGRRWSGSGQLDSRCSLRSFGRRSLRSFNAWPGSHAAWAGGCSHSPEGGCLRQPQPVSPLRLRLARSSHYDSLCTYIHIPST